VVGQLRKIRKGLRQDDTGNDGLHSAKSSWEKRSLTKALPRNRS
jgi:hypothetical protein